jgi:hypothetical protein
MKVLRIAMFIRIDTMRGTMTFKWGLTALVVIGVVGAALALPAPAAAQEQAITISAMAIEVWPEYDQPSALVFYRGQVAEGTPLPVMLRLTLPPTAAVNAVAYADPATGNLFDATYEMEGNVVVFASPTGAFHVEFYDTALQTTDDQRAYTLAWTADYAVQSLFFQVQQPIGASAFSVEPSGGASAIAQDGMTYYTVEYPALAAGQAATLTLQYTKADDILSVDALPATAEAIMAAAATTTAGGYELDAPESPLQVGGVPIWLIVAIVAGLVVVVGTAFLMLRTAGKFPGRGRGYCTNCGKAIQQGDSFCRHCGTRLG